MEEGEVYIQDFFGKSHFFDLTSNMYRMAETTIHFCSRSVILEFPKEPSLPIYKYHLRYFDREPNFNANFNKNNINALPMTIVTNRVIEVPINSKIPKPYVLHDAKENADALIEKYNEPFYVLSMNIDFHNISEFFSAIRDLFHLYK